MPLFSGEDRDRLRERMIGVRVDRCSDAQDFILDLAVKRGHLRARADCLR